MDVGLGVEDIVTTKAALAVNGGTDESVTVTAKLKDPEIVGVPNIEPVDDKSKPVGKSPPPIDQV